MIEDLPPYLTALCPLPIQICTTACTTYYPIPTPATSPLRCVRKSRSHEIDGQIQVNPAFLHFLPAAAGLTYVNFLG